MSHLVEDETFPYSGYAKATVADLVDGDGVRFTPIIGARCELVESMTVHGDLVDLILTDRSVHVASVFADAFHRPIEGMSADPGLVAMSVAAVTTVWIRL